MGFRKRIAAAVLATVVGVGLAPVNRTANAQSGKTLSVPFHKQNTMVWCWAASISMVVEYLKGSPIQDCEVLNRYDRSRNGPGQCCAGDPRCQRGSLPGEIGPILGNIFGVHGAVLNRSLTWSEIVENINANKPIIAWVWNSVQSAHVVVISGYSGGEDGARMLTVLDPLRGPMTVPFVNFASKWGPSHDWNISWVFRDGAPPPISGSAEPSKPRRVPCVHRTHPLGDTTQCIHGTMHQFDSMPCQHLCFWMGQPIACHPRGDMFACSHIMHPLGDVSPCTHPLHPAGDLITDDDDDE